MNPGVVLTERAEGSSIRKSASALQQSPARPTVLIATVDSEIRETLVEFLADFQVNAIWVSSVHDVKMLVARERIVACLCGFWLQGGTYREVIRHLRRERMDIPAIIVSGPTCPPEYRDYLAAMNLGALDFLCHPYQKADFDRMLDSAITSWTRSTGRQNLETIGSFPQRGAA
jgi:DNA-binding NtrC family response regulator